MTRSIGLAGAIMVAALMPTLVRAEQQRRAEPEPQAEPEIAPQIEPEPISRQQRRYLERQAAKRQHKSNSPNSPSEDPKDTA